MDQTLPRRGIEDSMYPKPVETDPFFDRREDEDIFDWMARHFGPPLPETWSSTTVTVLVEYDAALLTREQVADQVIQCVSPRGKAGWSYEGKWLWRARRAHPWNTRYYVR